MSNTEINRQIVRKGLDRRAAERRDAELEEQARKLRLVINANHADAISRMYPTEQPQRPQEEAKAKAEVLKRKQKIRAQRAAEAAYCTGWYSFLLRVFAPVIIAAVTMFLCNNGVLIYALGIPCAIVACAIGIEGFAARFLREC